MTTRVKAFFSRKIDRGIEVSIGVAFLAAMACAGWSAAGMM